MQTTILISAVVPIVITIVIALFVLRFVRKRVGGSGVPGLAGLAGHGGGGKGGSAGTSPEIARLQATGAKARARVMNVRSTGVVINQINVRCEVTFEIQPIDGEPSFSGSKVVTLTQTNMPRLGDQFPCWFDRANRSLFAVGLVQQLSHETVSLYREFGIPHPLDPDGAPAASTSGPASPSASGAADAGSTVEQLAALATMHAKGQLNDAEFAAAKAKLLG